MASMGCPNCVPSRQIFHGEARAWLDANAAPPNASVITSLPDVSELTLDLPAWRAWFIDTVRRIVRWTPEGGVAIFF